MPGDDIAGLVAAAGAGSDEAFRKVIAADGQAEDHTAPEALRKLLTSRRVLRMEMSQSYSHEGGKAGLIWWFGEIGFAGGEAEVSGALRRIMQDAGFKAREGEEALFTKSSGGYEQEVKVEGPRRWTGGRETACGVKLLWKVMSVKPSPHPALARVLEALPMLRDERLEARVYEALAGEPVESLSRGGTWTRYYDWDLALSPGSAEAAARLHTRLQGLLAELGYEPGRPDRESQGFERKKTGSFAWLTPADPDGVVRLRFQPES